MAVASLLLVAGCGGSSASSTQSSSATGSGPVTRAQFIARAGAICHALRAEEAALKHRVASLETASSAEKSAVPLISQIVGMERVANEKPTALSEPPQDAVRIGELFAGLAEEADDASSIEKAFSVGDTAASEAAENVLSTRHAYDQRLAQKLGLQTCVPEVEGG
jgi:hypothetical protein